MNRANSSETAEQSQLLAISALSFLAADADRLARFIELTGISPDELREQAGAPAVLAAVLDHLLKDESLLLVFAASKNIAPESIGTAHADLLDQKTPAHGS